MGLDVRIIAFRRHMPNLDRIDVANLEGRLRSTPAGPFVMDLTLDDAWWSWPDKYQARGEDGPSPHVQAIEVGSGVRYFGRGCHRGDWPAFKAIILWLREQVSPDVWYGFEDTEPCMWEADDELIAEHDDAWEACGQVSNYGVPWPTDT